MCCRESLEGETRLLKPRSFLSRDWFSNETALVCYVLGRRRENPTDAEKSIFLFLKWRREGGQRSAARSAIAGISLLQFSRNRFSYDR